MNTQSSLKQNLAFLATVGAFSLFAPPHALAFESMGPGLGWDVTSKQNAPGLGWDVFRSGAEGGEALPMS